MMMETWLNVFINLGKGEFLPKLLGIIVFIFLVGLVVWVFVRGLLLLFRYSLEWINTLIKAIGILAILLLIYVVFKVILDPNRPCRSSLESELTRCTETPQKEQNRKNLYREKKRNRPSRVP